MPTSDLQQLSDRFRQLAGSNFKLPKLIFEYRHYATQAGWHVVNAINLRSVEKPAHPPEWLAYHLDELNNNELLFAALSHSPPFKPSKTPRRMTIQANGIGDLISKINIEHARREMSFSPRLEVDDETDFVHRHIMLEAAFNWLLPGVQKSKYVRYWGVCDTSKGESTHLPGITQRENLTENIDTDGQYSGLGCQDRKSACIRWIHTPHITPEQRVLGGGAALSEPWAELRRRAAFRGAKAHREEGIPKGRS